MRRRRTLRLEALENRLALATAVVNMLGTAPDATPLDGVCDVDLLTPGEQCTLTAAAQHLNANNGGTLTFDINGTFAPVEFTQPVAINGQGKSVTLTTAQPLKLSAGGSVQNLILAGELHFQGSDGLITNNSIGFSRGLTVVGDRNVIEQNLFTAGTLDPQAPHGIVTIRGSSNRIAANSIGVSGNQSAANASHGIYIDGIDAPASFNTIIANTIGASVVGIEIRGAQATFNRLEANRIGTDANGEIDLGNAVGVLIAEASDTTIGGNNSLVTNLISGNGTGIVIISPAPRTLVDGNFIGLSANGSALGNDDEGVHIVSFAGAGDDITLRNNKISANGADGVYIEASGVKLLGNFIGTDGTGLLDRGNGRDGVRINANLSNPNRGVNGNFNMIGMPGQGNLISGNVGNGITIISGDFNTIHSNLVGVAASGDTALPNGSAGVAISDGEQNSIGDVNIGNLISGNGTMGVVLEGGQQNTVRGNTIGLNGNRTAILPNQLDGIEIRSSTGTKIGDTNSGAGNTIAGNGRHGVSAILGSSQTLVINNVIGTNQQAVSGLGNGAAGVHLNDAPQARVGQASVGNLIAGNSGTGISVVNSDGVHIRANLIGVGPANVARGNQQGGISVFDSAQMIIGGTNVSERNYISANGQFGIALGNVTLNAQILNNYIGPDLNGSNALPSAQQPVGVLIRTGSNNNLVGSTGTTGLGNLISGNTVAGVRIQDAGTSNNQVGGNVIGLSGSQQSPIPNLGDGIVFTAGASSNTIGGTLAGSGNIIAANIGNGILLDGGATLNTIQRNAIGYNPVSQQLFGNGGNAVRLNTTTNNLIGDPTGASGNAIRGHNQQAAIGVNAGATGNRILGNSMFLDSAGGIALTGPLASLLRQPIIRQVTPAGTSVNVSAQVAGVVGSVVRVDFYAGEQAPSSGFGEGQFPLGSTNVTIPAGGIATVNVSLPLPGPSFRFITATQTDNTNTTYSFSRATTPNHGPVNVTSLVTSGPTNDFQPVQFTATLQSSMGNPDGVVEFYDGSQLLGQATLNAQRQATLSVQIPQQGVHNIYAVYKGTALFGGVISSALAVNIVAAPPNQLPLANTDSAVVVEDGSVTINVLANDTDPDGGTIAATSVVITQQPQHGTASVNATTGVVTYTPHTNYDGADQFRYTITDNRGGVSTPGLVNVTVTDTPEPYYNRTRPVDVDNDGQITPSDVILIINQLNSIGAGQLPPPTFQVTVYADVDGDNALSPADALMVINHLNAFGVGEAASEPQVDAADPATPAANDAKLHDAALEAWLYFHETEDTQRKTSRTR